MKATPPSLARATASSGPETACMMADKGDVILVAGKGHEDYQEVKGVKHHFDDREELRAAFGDA